MSEEGRRIGLAALLLSSSVLLSRVLGYAREAVLAYRVGVGPSSDAYYAAFMIPDLLNYLLAGGALSIAFLPMYTRRRSGGESRDANHLMATVLGTLGSTALAATLVLWWFAPALVELQFPRFDTDTQALTTRLTRIVLPAQVFFVTGGIVNAALLSHGRFRATAVSPLIYNGCIIAGGLVLAPAIGVEGFAWGVLTGALFGPFLAPLLDARGRVPIRIRVAPLDRDFRTYIWIAAPLMFGQTLLTVDEWYERWFGALLGTGAVAYLSYARKLMLVPVAAVGQAIAAAALPSLARLYVEGRFAELNDTVERTLRAGIALAVFCAAGVAVLAAPLVRVLYERGAFEPADTVTTAALLAVLCCAVPGWITQQIVSRAFYAREDTWRPMILGTAIALLAIPLYLFLGRSAGITGLAIAGAAGMSTNALATVLLARRLHGAPRLTALFGTLLRAVLIAFPAAALTSMAVSTEPGANLGEALFRLFAGGVMYGAATLLLVPFLGDDQTRANLRRIFERSRRRRV